MSSIFFYAKFLRNFAESLGVERVEGVVDSVELSEENGNIKSVQLKSGQRLEADFFMDCSGFRGILIEKALRTGYEDWSHYLPCNRAIAVPCAKVGEPTPYTRATAKSCGWQWRIPLQHRTGNGHVYCSDFAEDQEIEDSLLENLDGKPLRDPIRLRFTTGKRRKIWNKNCVSVGLASGFLEPLESTSIHLIQTVISKFLSLFPTKHNSQVESDKFNQIIDDEFLSVRDFLILHYNATERTDSDFWNYCRTMAVPTTLENKYALYRSSGRLFRDYNELFDEASWLAVMHGQGVVANGYNPIVDALPIKDLETRLAGIRNVISKCAEAMPTHEEFIKKHCAAE